MSPAAAKVVRFDAFCDPRSWPGHGDEDGEIDPPPGAGAHLLSPWGSQDPEEPGPLGRFLTWVARLFRA